MVGALSATVNARAGRRVIIWGLLTAVSAAIMDFIPLFDLLGYDFSFVIGLMAALASVDIGAGVVTAARRQGRASAGVFRLAAEAAGWSIGVLVVPLLLSLLNALRVRNCNLSSGLEFYLLLPVAGALYGSGTGVLCGAAARRRGRLLALAIPVLSIIWTLARLYFDPAVFAYDPFGGYFPGPIYDEALRPSATLLTYRLCNLIWLAAALAVGWAAARPNPAAPPTLRFDVRRWPRLRLSVAAILVAASVLLFTQSAALRFHLRRTDLTQILDGERRSARVILRYATAAGISASDLDLTMEDLDFRYDQLRELFKVEPDRPITVYQFGSA